MIKRLAILIVYDSEGIADDYIFYLIDDLKKNVSHLVVVCNGEMQPDSLSRLEKSADEVFVRENKGYDAGALKVAFENLIGWNNVLEYDEVVMLNDTCYGPIYPLKEIFEEMEKRDCDYWGITRSLQFGEHIQSYFWTVKSNIIKSGALKQFWAEQKISEIHSITVTQYEMRIIPFFNALGYRGDTYVNCDDFFDESERNYNYSLFDTFKLIKECKCPLLKKKAFTVSEAEILQYNSGEVIKKTFDFITTQTEYPENIIWKNLIRTCDINDLRNILHLNYIFTSESIMFPRVVLCEKKAVVIAHLYYTDLIEYCFKYINEIPEYIDVIITTNKDENKQIIDKCFNKSGRNNYRIIETPNRGRDIGALLVACNDILMEYEYICFVHDKKSNSGVPYMTVGQSWLDILWENTLKSREYIENVLTCFENNPFLGVLGVPTPYVSKLITSSLAWHGNYENTLNLTKRLNLKCKISLEKYPFTLGSTFWCRTDALKTLFKQKYKYEDFPNEPVPIDGTISHAIERIFQYVAQHEGYYSGIMMTDEYASVYTVNLQNILNELIFNFDKYSNFLYEMAQFCNRNKKIYIYGAGSYAKHCISAIFKNPELLNKFSGHIVSDGKKNENVSISKNIFELSEIAPSDTDGIIIALNETHKKEVIPELEKRGFKNYICFDPAIDLFDIGKVVK